MFKQKLSGQSVLVLPKVTIKWGPGAMLQGDRMYAVEQHCDVGHLTPKIYAMFGGAYVMQTMTKPKRWYWHTAAKALKSLWALKETEIYGVPQPAFDTNALAQFLHKNASAKFIAQCIPMQYLAVNYGAANEATHGDPTKDNTMELPDGTYSFIDWLPQRRSFLPAHRDVDYGKLMQSLVLNDEMGLTILLMNEAPAAWFWCSIHFMRIAVRNPALAEWCDQQIGKCLWAKGMRENIHHVR